MDKKFVEVIFDEDINYYIVLKNTQEIKKIKQKDMQKSLETALNNNELLLEALANIANYNKEREPDTNELKRVATEAIEKIKNEATKAQ